MFLDAGAIIGIILAVAFGIAFFANLIKNDFDL
jgi:high-affinity Fe2+/Pb2+ permease